MTSSTKSKKPVTQSKEDAKLEKLREEKRLLENELETLKQIKTIKEEPPKKHTFWRSFFAGLTAIVAIICFVLFNISYWTQQTIINNEQFVATMSPIIKDPDVQAALQTEISTQIFSRINLQQELEDNLPPNLAFIAAPFADQVKSFATSEIGKVLKSNQVADAWTKLLGTAHSTLISYLQNPNTDGTITVNSIYKIATEQLQDTSIGFLFKNQLPSSVGNITITQMTWVPKVQQYLNLLQSVTRQLAIVGAIAVALAIALSTRRRKIIITMLVAGGIGLVTVTLAINVGQSQVGGQVASQYSAAATAVYKIVSQPLIQQLQGFEALIIAILVVTVLSAPYKWLLWIRGYINKGFDSLFKKIIKTKTALPNWINKVADARVIIGWVVIALSFAAFALRLPPSSGGAWAAIISSAIVIFILEIFASLSRCSSSQSKK